ncbi:MAG: class I SAM-dependent methyltransferase [Nitrospirota bacterium]
MGKRTYRKGNIMNYREKLYSTYVSTHTYHLYGEASIAEIERQFPVWRRYYGRFLPQYKSATILDIGCGNGGFVYFLQNSGLKNAMGVDVSKEQVEFAHKIGIESVVHADLKEFLSGQVEAYEVIFARDIIEHLTKDEILEVLETVYKALKTDGLFVVQAPNGESLFSGRLRYGDFTHEMVFTRSGLNQILKATGYRDIGFYPTGPVPKGFKSTVRYLLWKGIEVMLRFYMLVETGSSDGIFTQNIIAVAKK